MLVSVRQSKNQTAKLMIWNLKTGKTVKIVDYPGAETVLGIQKTFDSKILAISTSENVALFY
jgi:Tol biopolymer transport system component